MSLEQILLLGSYAFTAGAWGWAWKLYFKLSEKIDKLEVHLMNDLAHKITQLEENISKLEEKR